MEITHKIQDAHSLFESLLTTRQALESRKTHICIPAWFEPKVQFSLPEEEYLIVAALIFTHNIKMGMNSVAQKGGTCNSPYISLEVLRKRVNNYRRFRGKAGEVLSRMENAGLLDRRVWRISNRNVNVYRIAERPDNMWRWMKWQDALERYCPAVGKTEEVKQLIHEPGLRL